jgi:hypothetical protein
VALAAAVLAVCSGLAALTAVAGTDAHRSQHLTSTGGPAATRDAPPQTPTLDLSAAPSSSGSTLPPTAAPPARRSSQAAAASSSPSRAAGASVAAAPVPVLSRTVVGPLHTSGNRIYDATNKPILLSGINRYGLQADDTTNLTPDDIGHAKQWGANFVRLALGEQLWLADSCKYDPTYASKVDSAVSWITGRGMVALLDLHYNTVSPCGPVGMHTMADAPNSINFWEQVAARYKSNPLVAFDLYNEPNHISDSVWLNGGQQTEGGVVYDAAGMQQMYDAIRGQGANNLVFASGSDFARAFPPLLSGSNIVYAVHAYTCPNVPPPNCGSSDPYDPPAYLSEWLTPSQSVPVVLTEFGWPGTDDGRYNANMIAYAQSHGWGWSVFMWDGRTNSQWDLVENVGPGAAYDPTPSGMPVFSAMHGSN